TVGGGSVSTRWGSPSGPYDSPKRGRLSGKPPLLYSAAAHSIGPVFIMLFSTVATSLGWQPLGPHVRRATRRSPGLTNCTNSALSCRSAVYAWVGLAELRQTPACRGNTCACFLAAS